MITKNVIEKAIESHKRDIKALKKLESYKILICIGKGMYFLKEIVDNCIILRPCENITHTTIFDLNSLEHFEVTHV